MRVEAAPSIAYENKRKMEAVGLGNQCLKTKEIHEIIRCFSIVVALSRFHKHSFKFGFVFNLAPICGNFGGPEASVGALGRSWAVLGKS